MKTALITGASGGIGYELAKRCVKDHERIVLVARDEEKLQQVALDVKALGASEAIVLAKDLSMPHAAREIALELYERGIVLDALVNNAGYGLSGAFADLNVDDQLNMLTLNTFALTELTHAILVTMLARHSGRILNVASTAAFQPGPMMAVYYASKAYVLSFSEAIADEVRGSGVSVTCLCPGATRTEFQDRAGMTASRLFKSGAVMQPDAVARVGYRAMMRGQALAIPGPLNIAMTFSTRLAPRAVVTKIARIANSRDELPV